MAQENPTNPSLTPFDVAVLPLQGTTVFPETVVPLAVGRERSVAAVEAALATEEKLIACITAKSEEVTGSDAQPDDLYQVGTLVTVKRMIRDENTLQLIVQGQDRIRVRGWVQTEPFLKARVEILPPLKVLDSDQVEALRRNIQSMIQQ